MFVAQSVRRTKPIALYNPHNRELAPTAVLEPPYVRYGPYTPSPIGAKVFKSSSFRMTRYSAQEIAAASFPPSFLCSYKLRRDLAIWLKEVLSL